MIVSGQKNKMDKISRKNSSMNRRNRRKLERENKKRLSKLPKEQLGEIQKLDQDYFEDFGNNLIGQNIEGGKIKSDVSGLSIIKQDFLLSFEKSKIGTYFIFHNAGIEEVESCYPDGGPYKVCEELKQMDTLKYEGKPTPRVKVFKRVKS